MRGSERPVRCFDGSNYWTYERTAIVKHFEEECRKAHSDEDAEPVVLDPYTRKPLKTKHPFDNTSEIRKTRCNQKDALLLSASKYTAREEIRWNGHQASVSSRFRTRRLSPTSPAICCLIVSLCCSCPWVCRCSAIAAADVHVLSSCRARPCNEM